MEISYSYLFSYLFSDDIYNQAGMLETVLKYTSICTIFYEFGSAVINVSDFS